MEEVGFATVVANEPTPDTADGPGQVVTATFQHDSAKVLDLTFSPTGEFSSDSRLFPSGRPPTSTSAYSLKSQASRQSFGVTSAHPFWSVTRDEFVPAGDLEYGEQVVTIDGQLWHLTTITPRAGPETVYNFEVAGEHVYYAGSNGLLVHNSYLVDKLRSAKDLFGRAYKNVANRIKSLRQAKRISTPNDSGPMRELYHGGNLDNPRKSYVSLTESLEHAEDYAKRAGATVHTVKTPKKTF